MGGVLSLIATIAMIVAVMHFNNYEYVTKTLTGLDPLQVMVVIILFLIGATAVWLAVRVTGLYVYKRYIKQINYTYGIDDIFKMLGYILTANLCFTLVRAFTLSSGNNEGLYDEYRVIRGLIDVAIQAVIIGFITFIPKHQHPKLLEPIGGSHGYALIVISMIFSIVVLVFARQHLNS